MSDSSNDWQRWEMGSLERRRQHPTQTAKPPKPDAQQQQRRREDAKRQAIFEQAKKEGYEAGLKKGFEDGFNKGREEGELKAHAEYEEMLGVRLENTISPIAVLAEQFSESMASLNQDVSRQLAELALEAGRRLANRSLELNPEHILDDIESLLASEPTLTGRPRLFIHPDDLELVQSQLGEVLKQAGWQLLSDHDIQRGDCRIETDTREIDATRAGRWERLLQAVGHGEH
ncbi:flagellar assembly protein FliH [Larsenimonas salina]|uniref:flagellar assembly protein FliH n=1 Tax=Larsenimonas salina TaxID=1295565 RepID=UPI00207310CB|nr:flagellar assembly protein FliH [Larsenimonas salina]MCM5703711.1 flagellar assembly protein FliH [Larsenimonas salina]